MTIERAQELMLIEKQCVIRAKHCDRQCDKCDLVQDDEELRDAYDLVYDALNRVKFMGELFNNHKERATSQ